MRDFEILHIQRLRQTVTACLLFSLIVAVAQITIATSDAVSIRMSRK